MNNGDKLKKIRKKLGVTQSQFADNYGFSRSTISEFENNIREIPIKSIRKIARGTNTNLNYWIEETDDSLKNKYNNNFYEIINNLHNVGEIDRDGKCSEEAKNLLIKILETEIKEYIADKEKNKEIRQKK